MLVAERLCRTIFAVNGVLAAPALPSRPPCFLHRSAWRPQCLNIVQTNTKQPELPGIPTRTDVGEPLMSGTARRLQEGPVGPPRTASDSPQFLPLKQELSCSLLLSKARRHKKDGEKVRHYFPSSLNIFPSARPHRCSHWLPRPLAGIPEWPAHFRRQ